jgi:hypothetical protein
MSRHHMLPPIVYVPQPKPKKIEPRKSRIQMRSAGKIEDADEAEETYESIGPSRLTPVGNKSPPENFSPIEGSEKKPQPPMGLLSENTLKVLLLAQEISSSQ